MADDLSKRPDFGPKEDMPWDKRPAERKLTDIFRGEDICQLVATLYISQKA